MSVWVIVVAAGSGSRFGGPKQYDVLGDRRVLDWAIASARSVADGVVVVVPASRADDLEVADFVVAGGATRSDSVRAGLTRVPDTAEVIVVHDAARPLAEPELFEAVVQAVREGADGAVPALPVTDTVKRVSGNRVLGTIDRRELVSVQTPQAFDGPALRAAHKQGDDATDDAALVESSGGVVVTVAGDPSNIKLTTATDLEEAETILVRRGSAQRR